MNNGKTNSPFKARDMPLKGKLRIAEKKSSKLETKERKKNSTNKEHLTLNYYYNGSYLQIDLSDKDRRYS